MKAPPMKKLAAPKEKRSNSKSDYSSNYDNRPTFTLSASQVPEIKTWQLKKQYYLTIKVEMTSKRIEDWEPNKGEETASFKMVAVGVAE